MMIADVAATSDDNMLIAKSSGMLRHLQDEVIKVEDLKTDTSITTLGGVIFTWTF